MRFAPKPAPVPAGPNLAPFDLVALVAPWPDAGLPAGTWGHVLSVNDDGTYEVEFIDAEAEPVAVVVVPGAAIELVWADPG